MEASQVKTTNEANESCRGQLRAMANLCWHWGMGLFHWNKTRKGGVIVDLVKDGFFLLGER